MKIFQVDTYFTTILISYFYNKQNFKYTYMALWLHIILSILLIHTEKKMLKLETQAERFKKIIYLCQNVQ